MADEQPVLLRQFERWRISVAYNEDRLGYTLNIGGYLQWHKYGLSNFVVAVSDYCVSRSYIHTYTCVYISCLVLFKIRFH